MCLYIEALKDIYFTKSCLHSVAHGFSDTHTSPARPVSGNGRTWPEPNGSGRRGSAANGSGVMLISTNQSSQPPASPPSPALPYSCRADAFEQGAWLPSSRESYLEIGHVRSGRSPSMHASTARNSHSGSGRHHFAPHQMRTTCSLRMGAIARSSLWVTAS